jgi:hypothetical protein
VSYQRIAAIYRDFYGREYPLPPPASGQRPLDEQELKARWDRVRADLAELFKDTSINLREQLSHPQLSGLEKFIRNSWQALGEQETFLTTLGFINRMQEEPLATRVGLDELSEALDLAGQTERLATVANLATEYLEENPFWRDFQKGMHHETHIYEPFTDYIPGGLPDPPEPEEPLDEPEGSTDAFFG